MQIQRKQIRFVLPLVLCCLLFWCGDSSSYAQSFADQATTPNAGNKRPVTMTDAIQMTQFGDPWYLRGLSAKHKVAGFSPNGSRFVIVIKKGNLDKNTNDYSLLLFRTADAFHSPSPEVLVSFSSSSNRPGIQQVTWLDDDTIAFLGENPGEEQQLYRFTCKTEELKILTNHPTGLISYAINAKKYGIFFVAEPAVKKMLSGRARREGIVISTQLLPDLFAGDNHMELGFKGELFAKRGDSGVTTKIELADVVSHNTNLWPSPDGRFLILDTFVTSFPESWKEYDDSYMQRMLRKKGPKSFTFVRRYTLVETSTGQNQPLLNAPIPLSSEVAWSPDSRSVVVAGTYLPLDVADAAERKSRQSGTFVAEIKLPSREIVPITQKQLKLLRWDPRTDKILLESATRFSTVDMVGNIVAYQKSRTGWTETEATAGDISGNGQLDVDLEEDLNTPPKVIVADGHTGQKSLLVDLNPQFRGLNFGTVEQITFKARDGRTVNGGLYRPPEFVAGKRYPLVIQTHGWNPQRFWIDGPYSTAFAAQPLAGRGIVVLQLEEDLKYLFTKEEGPLEMSAYEGAIDYLDGRGLIDRTRVGIIGFSRTNFHVKYTLTHSSYSFAAASIAAGFDAGYFQYLTFVNAMPEYAESFEVANGGPPFGDGLSTWMELSPGFHLEKVHTPVRIQANERESLFSEWEWFSGLSRLGKSVDMIYLPQADHVLVKPWERMASQDGNVDWFRFWLKGEEDPDPAKTEQYARWRALRKMQAENDAKNKPAKEKPAPLN